MQLKYITCSDPRETVKYSDLHLLSLLSPKVEFGIQAHPSAMAEGLPRNQWFNTMLKSPTNKFNLALHINYQWCDDFCSGIIPAEILKWLHTYKPYDQGPRIKRIQLNVGDGTVATLNTTKLAKVMQSFPSHEFILPYNPKLKDFIEKMHNTGAKFSLLYDNSYGRGICPNTWDGPVYENHVQGYAGGLCGENIKQNLKKISEKLPENYETWIDAEGRLMVPGTRHMDFWRARKYILGALEFEQTR